MVGCVHQTSERDWVCAPIILTSVYFENAQSPDYPIVMAVNWLEVAQKMAEDARAQLAINRKRLREILAERARQEARQESHTNTR
jgi:hypothetical protein